MAFRRASSRQLLWGFVLERVKRNGTVHCLIGIWIEPRSNLKIGHTGLRIMPYLSCTWNCRVILFMHTHTDTHTKSLKTWILGRSFGLLEAIEPWHNDIISYHSCQYLKGAVLKKKTQRLGTVFCSCKESVKKLNKPNTHFS